MYYERIKDEINKQGLSVSRVEKETGLGNGTIRSWAKSTPRLDSFLAVVRYLGLDVCEILKEE